MRIGRRTLVPPWSRVVLPDAALAPDAFEGPKLLDRGCVLSPHLPTPLLKDHGNDWPSN